MLRGYRAAKNQDRPCTPEDRTVRRRDLPGGMVKLELWPFRADGVVALADHFLSDKRGSGTGGDRYQVNVHVDQDPLAPDGTVAATLEDGTPVSAETFRRVACDCGLVAVGHAGERLDIGRRSRAIPPAIRRALMLRDRGCALLVSTHMIESVEEDWDVPYIMVKGRIARVCRRTDLAAGQSLEDVYFTITEGKGQEDKP